MKNATKIILLIGIIASSHAYATQPTCFGLPNGEAIANYQDPNQYYLCQNNIPIPMVCPYGFVYCNLDLVSTCEQSCPNLNPAPIAPTPAPIVWYPTARTQAPINWYPTARTPAPINWYPTAPTPAPTSAQNPWFPTARTPAQDPWFPTAPTPAKDPWFPTAPTPAQAENPWFPTAPTPAESLPTAPTVSPLVDPNECVNRSNNIIFPIPGSCTGYATCVDGKPVAGNCFGNRAFDGTTGTCGENLC